MGCPLLDDASLTGRQSGIGTGSLRKLDRRRVYLCAGGFHIDTGNAPRLAASVWLDSQPWHLSDVPILIDPECKKIETLSACAGVHKNLVPLPASQSKRSLTLF